MLTLTHGNKFEKTEDADIYTLKVGYGAAIPAGLVDDNSVDTKTRIIVEREAEKFVASRAEYNNYEIIDYDRDRLITYMTYRVKFSQ